MFLGNSFNFSQVNIHQKVDSVVLNLAFKSKLVGTSYLKDALLLAIDGQKLLLTTQVYPTIAQKYDTSPSNVEKSMRNAIQDCFYNGQLKRLNNIALCKVIDDKYPPSNGELIATLVRVIKLYCM